MKIHPIADYIKLPMKNHAEWFAYMRKKSYNMDKH